MSRYRAAVCKYCKSIKGIYDDYGNILVFKDASRCGKLRHGLNVNKIHTEPKRDMWDLMPGYANYEAHFAPKLDRDDRYNLLTAMRNVDLE